MLLVEYFSGEVYKLRGFLTQIKIKITNKGLGVTKWGTEYFNFNNWARYVNRINRQDLTRVNHCDY